MANINLYFTQFFSVRCRCGSVCVCLKCITLEMLARVHTKWMAWRRCAIDRSCFFAVVQRWQNGNRPVFYFYFRCKLIILDGECVRSCTTTQRRTIFHFGFSIFFHRSQKWLEYAFEWIYITQIISMRIMNNEFP